MVNITRVCVFWSSKLSFLYPGTIMKVFSETQYVLIRLDDGDEQEINIANVRLLPRDYPRVDCKDKESPIGFVEVRGPGEEVPEGVRGLEVN